MSTVGFGAVGISLTMKSDANKRLSSTKNLHRSLQTVYDQFINSPHQHHIKKSLFPLSMKIFERSQKRKPVSQTSSCTSTSRLMKVKAVGVSNIQNTETETAPEIGVAVFILKDNKMLIGRRRSLYVAANTYGLPAGHLELGESYEECAAREVKEETGLDIKNIELLSANNLYYDAMHLNVTYMRAQLSDPNQTPQNIEPDRCEGWEWYDLDNLPEPMFGPLGEMLRAGFDPFASST